MPATFGLEEPKFLNNWMLVRHDLAQGDCCQRPGCHHKLTRGTAFIARDPQTGTEFEVGPECAKRYGTPRTVPVLADVKSLLAFKSRPSKRLIAPPIIAFDEERLARQERADDEAYLLLRAKTLPALGFRTLSPIVITAWEPYQRGPQETDLSEIRRLRHQCEGGDRRNSLETLRLCYAAVFFIDRFLDPKRPEHRILTRHDLAELPHDRKAVIRDHALPEDRVSNLNRLIAQAHPRDEFFNPTALKPVEVQPPLFAPTPTPPVGSPPQFALDPDIPIARPRHAPAGQSGLLFER